MPFTNLGLIEPLLRSVRSEGYTKPTTIQEQAIPPILAGQDVLGCAQTGTGKTAAFALPLIQQLHSRPVEIKQGQLRMIRALILAPTRELAAQIGESFHAYGRHAGLRHTVIFGGVKQFSQEKALKGGVDILVATPGRLLDLMNQRIVNLRHVEILVLDEADRMLDMGFINDIRRVIAQVPAKRQTLLFSATMPQEIEALANSLLKSPVRVRVASESPAAKTVRQSVYFVESHQKLPLLEHLLSGTEITRALVFARTKRGADKVAQRLSRSGIASEAIHSNKSQNQRMKALANFKAGKTRVLAASDIASRGLDVDDISHVINYDIPHEAETYVHRIGRTGRAGAAGEAISLCSADQRGDWRAIERLVGGNIKVLQPSIELPAAPPAPAAGSPSQERSGGRGQRPAAAGGKPGAGAASSGQGSRRSKSPEQQKNNFWRNRHKSTRQTKTSSESAGRSSHRQSGR